MLCAFPLNRSYLQVGNLIKSGQPLMVFQDSTGHPVEGELLPHNSDHEALEYVRYGENWNQYKQPQQRLCGHAIEDVVKQMYTVWDFIQVQCDVVPERKESEIKSQKSYGV